MAESKPITKEKRSYKHDEAKINKEFERVNKRVEAVFTEAQKQKSVRTVDTVNEKITENVFHIDRDGNVYIKTKLGLKQLQFV